MAKINKVINRQIISVEYDPYQDASDIRQDVYDSLVDQNINIDSWNNAPRIKSDCVRLLEENFLDSFTGCGYCSMCYDLKNDSF